MLGRTHADDTRRRRRGTGGRRERQEQQARQRSFTALSQRWERGKIMRANDAQPGRNDDAGARGAGRPERGGGGGGGRRRGTQLVFEVVRTERLSSNLVRVHLGGDAFDTFIANADAERLAKTDKYVKLLFAKPELGLEPPYDLDALRERLAP
ncbi:hypothetical protein [Microbacterium sp. LRZ72]|uniref:hypothetical protein n=1 Tax=Microbacterium sp. LRZ72 TaxID=2942481 RepID=UPI0029BFBCED|nr:hypothetical protein [Microbacterium sp. LRZ72]